MPLLMSCVVTRHGPVPPANSVTRSRGAIEAPPLNGYAETTEDGVRVGLVVQHDLGDVDRLFKRDVLSVYELDTRSAADGVVLSDRLVLTRRDGTEVAVLSPAVVTSEHVASATLTFDRGVQPSMLVTYTDEGALRSAAATTRLVGQQIVFSLDGTPFMEPLIQEPLTGGSAQLSGNDLADATFVVAALSAPPLPCAVTVQSVEEVAAET